MIIKHGNMFDHLEEADLVFVTTNGTRKQGGFLVMGRGAALQFKQQFPTDYKKLSHLAIVQGTDYLNCIVYNLVYSGKFGLFQVKYDYWNKADLDMIKESTEALTRLAKKLPNKTIFLNFPGIGNGKLTEESVLPVIKNLPDNVIVWKL